MDRRQLTQTDARGHKAKYSHDGLMRVTSKIPESPAGVTAAAAVVKQTFNQCMAANASNFSLVGGVDRMFGSSFGGTFVGGLFGGNSITGLIYGSADDNAPLLSQLAD